MNQVKVTVRDVRDKIIATGFAGGASISTGSDLSAATLSCTQNTFSIFISRDIRSRLGPGVHPIKVRASDVDPFAGSRSSAVVEYGLPVRGSKTALHRLEGVKSDCRFMADLNWAPHLPQGGCGSNPNPGISWIIRGTNENSSFGPEGYFLPNDPIISGTAWQTAVRPYFFYSFNPIGDGSFQVGWVVDKLNFPQDLNRYSYAALNDVSLSRSVYLEENLFIDVDMGLFASQQGWDSTNGFAKIRSSVGLLASWVNGGVPVDAFLEVNLFRTSNFDLCTSTENTGGSIPSFPCDSLGIYARRSFYGVGEVVYYDIATMSMVAGIPQTGMVSGGGLTHFTLPVAQLFREYAWVRPPGSWSVASISGMYVGHEVWGKGRVWTEMRGYRLYAFEAE